jgi:predicted RNA-binding protein associated with RNAse of E/G family
MLKVKHADRRGWKRLKASRFWMERVETPEFTGYITLLALDAVRDPLIVSFKNRRLRIADNGYAWLMQFPDAAHHVITTMFDDRGRITQCYIDMCRQTGIDNRGIPWLEDLYLDLAIIPPGEYEVLDADELRQALSADLISQADYDLAWVEANTLIAGIQADPAALFNLASRHREQLLGQPQ